MSDFLFRLPQNWKLSPYHLNSIYVLGLDGVPWPCKSTVEHDEPGSVLKITRNQSESGRIYIVYPNVEYGEMLICTGTLPVSDSAYNLLKELARGTLNRLRNQLSIWLEGGLDIGADVNKEIESATGHLGQAIMCGDPAIQDEHAAKSLESAFRGIFLLSQQFGDQVSAFRRENQHMENCWFAVNTGTRLPDGLQPIAPWADLFQCKRLPVAGESNSTITDNIILGPWLNASAGGMNDSLRNLESFQQRRLAFLTECQRQIAETTSAVSIIHVASGLNGIGHRDLSYPQQIQLTSELIQLAGDAMIETPVMISFDFPWAERLASVAGGIHPLQIADSILRQGARINFLGLEINLDYWPNGSVLRDPLQWIDLIDIWTQLELPLVLFLRIPDCTETNHNPSDNRLVNRVESAATESQRTFFLKTVLPMMASRPSVHGMVWNQWCDEDDWRFPGAGIVSADNQVKPVGQVLNRLQKTLAG